MSQVALSGILDLLQLLQRGFVGLGGDVGARQDALPTCTVVKTMLA